MDGKDSFYKNSDLKSNQMLKTFTSKDGTNYLASRDFLFFTTKSFKNLVRKIKNMEIRDDDICVCSYPKSGTTWVQEMVWCIANGIDHEDGKKNINDRFQFLEFPAFFDFCKNDDLSKNLIEMIKDDQKHISTRFMKTHLPFNALPQKLKNFSTNARIIHVLRNPRDTMISGYHFCRILGIYKGSFQQFANLFLDGEVPFGPFPDHLQGYLAHDKNQKILFLKYEEMHQDLKSVIYKTANFIGKSIGENDVAKLIDHLSFSSMKQNPAANCQPLVMLVRKVLGTEEDTDGHFMRRGIVGDWKESLDSELCERFSKWEAENLKDVEFALTI